jgi:NADPH-dependent ferric siderophore reductase
MTVNGRPTGRPGGRAGERTTIRVRVHSVVDVNPRMREIRLQSPALGRLRFGVTSHVVVRVPVAGGTARRVYSVWAPDRASGVIRLRIALHGGVTPGCGWALSATAGDEVLIEPPRTKIAIDPRAPYHLLIGEETAAVPLLSMRAALYHSDDARGSVYGVLESPGPETEVPGARGVPALPWVHRGDAPATGSAVLVRAIRELSLPGGPGVAYVAGESLTCRLLQRHLVEERGWPANAIKMQQHWAAGKLGFGAGR